MKPKACILLLCGCFLGALSTPGTSQDDERAPVPEKKHRDEARKLIREVFETEYSKKAAVDRRGLAEKLIRQGSESKDDMATRYVLFEEARDLAVQAVDAELAFEAIKQLTRFFQVDAIQLRKATLSTLGKKAKTNGERIRLALMHLRMADEAVAVNDFSAASASARSAQTLAKRAKQVSLAARAKTRSKEIKELQRRFDELTQARETLAGNPDDPQANLAVGRFMCFDRDNWTEGLSFLAKGSGGPLNSLATKELAEPTDAAEQMEVGDRWWGLAEKEKGAVRQRVRRHAATWYEKAVGELSGLRKVKVQKRLTELRREMLKGSWISVQVPKMWGYEGDAGEEFDLIPARGVTYSEAHIVNFPEGVFDGISAVIRIGSVRNRNGLIHFENRTRAIGVNSVDDRLVAIHREETGWKIHQEVEIGKQSEYEVFIILSGGEYIIWINGEEKMRIKTDATEIDYMGIQSESAKVTFYNMKLRRMK